jgi:4a-hydroxytetrahydrobiopterin dehydratase
MPELVRLSDSDVEARIAALDGWQLREGSLFRELHFRDFIEAFSFMTAVALAAERRNHHPEWSNVYSTVTIRLSTHDVGGISDNDFSLAAEISQMYQRSTSIRP